MRKKLVYILMGFIAILSLNLSITTNLNIVASSEQPRYGGTIILVVGNDPISLNYVIQPFDVCGAVCEEIFNKLVTLDENYSIKPDLAESWEISQDGMTFTFHLAQNVKWHDGEPFSSDDVKFTFDYIRTNSSAAAYAKFKHITSIETPDLYTVVFHLEHPDVTFLANLAFVWTTIMPKHLYENTDWATNPYNKKPIGTGPFKFKEWVKDEYIILEANTEYFKGRPYLDKIIFKIIPDKSTALISFKSGEVDVLTSMQMAPFSEIPALEDQGYRVTRYSSGAMWGLEFNLKHPILSNIKVRHAIAHAINKTKIVEVAYFGVPIVPPNANPIAPIFKWAWNPNATEYEYNPQKAEQLLDEAGYPRGSDGIRFEVTLDFMNYMSGDREMWIMVQEMLNEVGIKVNLREWGDWGSYFDHFMSGNWELNWAWGGPGPDPSGYDRFFLSDATYNKAGYNNTRVDELFAEVTKTFNQTRRQEIFYEIGKILSDDLPRIPIWVVTSAQVWKPEFIGYPDGASLVWYDLANVWWTKGQAISPAIALEAIQDAESLIAKLKSGGYDVKNAEKKLNWAKDAFNVGLYELAYSLASEAKELANQLITAPPYLIYAALILIIIFAISLAVYWYRRKKS